MTVPQELFGHLIKTHHRLFRIIRLLTDCQDVFYNHTRKLYRLWVEYIIIVSTSA